MFDDCLIELACAVIELAREDYLTPLPGLTRKGFPKYQRDVDVYLRNRNSARNFFNSKWFNTLSLNQLTKEEVIAKLDEKVVKQNVNDCRISK